MKTALLLIAMVISANCAIDFHKYPVDLTGKRNLMKVMAQVEAALKTGGAYEAINKVLDDFQNAVVKEQAAHDGLHERQTAECNSEFEFRSKEVADAASALKQGQATLDGCKDQSLRANGDLIFTRRVLAETESYIRVMTEARQQQTEAFEATRAAYEFNSAGLDEAINILEEVFTGESSLVQLVKHTYGLLTNAAIIKAYDHFAPVMGAFAQITAAGPGDQELLEQVRNFLTRLRNDVEADWNEDLEAEEQAQEEFEVAIDAANTTLGELTDQKGSLEYEIAELSKCIMVETGVVASAQAKRDRNQRLWDDAHQLCETGDNEYTSATAQRREERDVIDALRQKVEARFGLP